MRLDFESLVAVYSGVFAILASCFYVFAVYPGLRVLPHKIRVRAQNWYTSLLLSLTDGVINRAVKFKLSGDSADPHESALVIANHQTMLDMFVIHALAKEMKSRASCYFNANGRCVTFPNLATVLTDYWHEASRLIPLKKLDHRFEDMHTALRRRPQWVVMFPEGDPYSVQRSNTHQIICKASGAKPLKHLLYPRLASTSQTVQYLRTSAVTSIYDLTIRYSQAANANVAQTPSILDLISSNKEWVVSVRMDRIPVSDVPRNRKKLERWIEKRWYAKDRTLQKQAAQSPAFL